MVDNARPALLDVLSQRYEELRRRLARALGCDDLAGDALHDTWLRLRRMESSDAVILNPRAFLLRMAVNSAISSLRSQSRAVPRREIEALLDVADLSAGPEQATADRREVQALLEIIARMPQRRQDILILVRVDGLSQKDVARRLGVSLSTVEQELKKAQLHCASRMAGRNSLRVEPSPSVLIVQDTESESVPVDDQ